MSQHIDWVLFSDIKLLIFRDFTKQICCFFVVYQSIKLLAKVQLIIIDGMRGASFETDYLLMQKSGDLPMPAFYKKKEVKFLK